MKLMEWTECEKEFVRKTFIDAEKIKSLVETAVKRQKYIESQEVTKESVSFVIEGYYEAIKELLSAFLLKHGIKSKNHQCLITFFYRQNPDYGYEANLISQMSYLRNRLNYYGEPVEMGFYEKNRKEIKRIIGLLRSKIGEFKK